MRSGGRTIRGVLALAVMAGVLVPSLAAPARTLRFPRTLHETFRTAVAAPGRPHAATFDAPATHVGFSWTGGEGSGVAFRTVSATGERSRWQHAPEAHDAEDGDRHHSAVIAVPRVTAIRWRPSRRSGPLRDVVVDALNTVDGDTFDVTVPATAEAAAATPDVITRAEWGADESLARRSGGCKRRFYPLQQLFVHHTAGANFDTHPYATMRAILWFHTQRQGWCDIGYNFVIAPDGRIFEGRWARSYGPWELHDSEDRYGRVVAGAHVSGYNQGSLGVSLMGNFTQIQMPPAMRRSLTEFLAWEADRHELPPRRGHTYVNPATGTQRWLPYIAGHRDAGYTECPGGYVYRALPSIRDDARRVIGNGKMETIVTIGPRATRIDAGTQVTLTGTVTDASGMPLPGRDVRTYIRKPGVTWTSGPEAVSGVDGTFTVSVSPRRRFEVFAVYYGDDYTWGDESPSARIDVRPLLTLGITNGEDLGGVAHIPADQARAQLAGTIRPRHVSTPVGIRIQRVEADGSRTTVADLTTKTSEDGAFAKGFLVPEESLPVTYAARASFAGDLDHLPAKSAEVLFVVDPRT